MLKIIKPGVFTTVQDMGRIGYQQYGVIISGVMDKVAFRIGNALLQQANKAALEMTLIGGEFQFTKQTAITLTGGKLEAKLNGKPIAMNKVITIHANDILKCGTIRSGARSYLCIAGGFLVEDVLGSKSTNVKASIGGYEGRKLQANDCISYHQSTQSFKGIRVSAQHYYEHKPIRILQGTEWEQFSEASQASFLQQHYTISLHADRMGYRLYNSQRIQAQKVFQLLSEAVTFGTIQIPTVGQPIVLMADHQTTGGYPKIAQVIHADLHRLAQLGPKQMIQFELVTFEQAEQAYIALEQQLQLLEILLIH